MNYDEGFVDIPGFPGYRIHPDGRVLGKKKHLLKACPLNQPKGRFGCVGQFLIFSLVVGKKRVPAYVHRLLALTFIPNNDPKLVFVVHKDQNLSNNALDNLMWSENRYLPKQFSVRPRTPGLKPRGWDSWIQKTYPGTTKTRQCEHCSRIFRPSNYYQHHGPKCWIATKPNAK